MRTNPRDPTAVRHRGNLMSDEAFRRIAPGLSEKRRWILRQIVAAGERGLTCSEAVELINRTARSGRSDYGENDISGRFTELRQAGLIAPRWWGSTRRNRDGNRCTVWVAIGGGET